MARGRPKGSKNRPKNTGATESENVADPSTEVSPGVGHNSELTDEQRQTLTYQAADQLQRLVGEKDSVVGKIRSLKKQIKSDLGAGGVADVELVIRLRSPEGEDALKAKIEAQARIMRWLGIPIGTQGSLFPDVDMTPSDDKAYAHGKRDGLAGAARSTDYHPATSQSHRYSDGYDEGQAVLVATKLRPLSEAEPAATTLISAAEAETRDAERLAEHDAAAADEWDDSVDTVDEAQRRMRVEAGLTEGLADLSREQAATLGDQPATYREVN